MFSNHRWALTLTAKDDHSEKKVMFAVYHPYSVVHHFAAPPQGQFHVFPLLPSPNSNPNSKLRKREETRLYQLERTYNNI